MTRHTTASNSSGLRGSAKVRLGPEGVHLFDRDTGLNILLDEVSPPEADWSLGPRFVSFALTNACELECAYCYAPKHVARLEAEAMVAWAVELDAAGTLGIGFGGGEPTLFPGFATLCRGIHDRTRLALSATTHGHRWTGNLVDAVGDSIQFLRVSMDGIGSTYEKLRGRPFEAFAVKLRLIASNYRFGVNVVVNENTLPELDAIADFAFRHGAQELLLLPEVGPDARSVLSASDHEALDHWVGRNYRDRRLAISATSAETIASPLLPLTVPGFADRDFMHVDASAVLRLCAYGGEGLHLTRNSSIIDSISQLRTSTKPLKGGVIS